MEGDDVVNQEGLANASGDVVVPVDMSRMRLGGDNVVDGILLPAAENSSYETILACRKANSCTIRVTKSTEVRHVASNDLGAVVIDEELLELFAGEKAILYHSQVGARAIVGGNAMLLEVMTLSAVVAVGGVVSASDFDVSSGRQEVLHLVEGELLLHLDVCLAMNAVGRGTDLAAIDEVAHNRRVELERLLLEGGDGPFAGFDGRHGVEVVGWRDGASAILL